jgi:hypothetical protein
MKARTVPKPNGLGKWSRISKSMFLPAYCSPAESGKMSVAFCLIKARQAMVLSLPVLTSRTAGYGPVCPVVWEGRLARGVPIPISVFSVYIH